MGLISFVNNVNRTYESILTPEAVAFLEHLASRYSSAVDRALAERRKRQRKFDEGTPPSFLEETKHIRESEWLADPTPIGLADRRVEITGPVERKMIINALNSGANVFMADFEDSSAPTFKNMMDGQANLRDAVNGDISYTHPETGRVYELKSSVAKLMVRPRGWHLKERHVLFQGKPMPAALVDFGLFFFHNAPTLVKKGLNPCFYLPKLESHTEARLWNTIINDAEEKLGIPPGRTKVTVLIETLPAAFEMDEIIYELKNHIIGLNCGRWDYIFSAIKVFRNDPKFVLPDRAQVGMTQPFMHAYSRLLIKTCHRRGIHAMGGMAAQIPIKGDEVANEAALTKVAEDKRREVNDGHDGTWVAHPGLVELAKSIFNEKLDGPNQIHVMHDDLNITEDQLTEVPKGTCTLAGLRQNIMVGIRYIESWLRGQGCVPIYNLMEDAATAEISRAQCWQWVRFRIALDNGNKLTPEYFIQVAEECLQDILNDDSIPKPEDNRFYESQQRFIGLVLDDTLADFLTLELYEELTEGFLHTMSNTDRTFLPVERPYSQEDVKRLQGSVKIEHTLARLGAERLRHLLTTEQYVNALGALTGNQAVQQVRAGLKAIYVSGWQCAADANLAGQMYPDQSLYPANSVPELVKRINQALQRADQIEHAEGATERHWFAPIVADAEAGFGGPLNVFELMKAMIEAGAAGVHFEDQLSSEKKCGHLGGKVLVPTSHFVRSLIAARLAADVMDVPTVLIARTDANAARLLTSDVDPYDDMFIMRDAHLEKQRTPEGFYRVTGGIEQAIARGLAYAPYADILWCETSKPDLGEAKMFADAIHEKFPGKLLAYNCSPSFNWRKNLDDETILRFQKELGAMGYVFQFVTLAGFHALNHSMFELSKGYRERGMDAYANLQDAEFDAEKSGYTATKHQREVGTGYFDTVSQMINSGKSSTLAMDGSTESEQF